MIGALDAWGASLRNGLNWEEESMLRQVWNAHRGWAKLARDMQSQTQRWNLAALLCIVAAAIFGAVA